MEYAVWLLIGLMSPGAIKADALLANISSAANTYPTYRYFYPCESGIVDCNGFAKHYYGDFGFSGAVLTPVNYPEYGALKMEVIASNGRGEVIGYLHMLGDAGGVWFYDAYAFNNQAFLVAPSYWWGATGPSPKDINNNGFSIWNVPWGGFWVGSGTNVAEPSLDRIAIGQALGAVVGESAPQLAYGINDKDQILADIIAFPEQGTVHRYHGVLSPFDATDKTPPTTVAIPTPSPNTNGWNKTNVTINLNATDNPGGSGVKQIEYALGGAQNTGWEVIPADAASVGISAEGTTVLSYGATDQARNQETTKTLSVNLDKTPPVISGLPAAGCVLWPANAKMVQVATVRAVDVISGLAPGSFGVTGTSNESSDPTDIVITQSSTGGYVVQLRADRLGTGTGRVYSLNATATDLAGNIATATATCMVPHDQGSL